MSASVLLVVHNTLNSLRESRLTIQAATDAHIKFTEEMIRQIVQNFDDLIKYHQEGRGKLASLVKTAPDDEQEMLRSLILQIDEKIKILTDQRADSLVPARSLISNLTGVAAKLTVIYSAKNGDDETE